MNAKSIRLIRTAALCLAVLTMLLSFAACGKKSSDAFVFKGNGVNIPVNAMADEVIPSLGTPSGKAESPSCGGIPGTDKVYTYAGFRVYTTPAEKGDKIIKVELIDDSVKTPEGLCIGTKADQVPNTLKGVTAEKNGANLIFQSGSVKLQVIVREGFVVNIQYVAA